MVVFIERNSDENNLLKQTLQTIDSECEWIFVRDVCEYVVQKEEVEPCKTKDLYYAFLEVPEFWKVRPKISLGEIYDLEKKKATIYFREPQEKRIVERVEWLSESGYVYKIDYYNEYGFIGCSILQDASGKQTLKTYYTSKREEIVSHNLVNDTVTVFEQGCVKNTFDSFYEFEKNMYTQIFSFGESIILTSLRQVKLLSEVDVHNEAKACILLNDEDEIEMYQKNLGTEYKDYPLFTHICYKSDFNKRINANGDVLILTRSDQIEGIIPLIMNFSDTIFHIAANTQVSSKLLSLNNYSNVKIYPQISMEQLERLFEKCSFYLDINYGREFYNAVVQASLNKLLILAFDVTLHNKYYVLDECVFTKDNYEGLMKKLKSVMESEYALRDIINRQCDMVNASLDMLRLKLDSWREC